MTAELFEADRHRLPQLRRTDRDRGMDRDTPFWSERRQCNRAQRGDGLVFRSDSARSSRKRADRQRRRCRQAVPEWRCNGLSRPDQYFRGFAGQVASGRIAPGDEVRILPSGRIGRIDRIVTRDGDLPGAIAGQSVTLSLTQEIDCSRATSSPRRRTRPTPQISSRLPSSGWQTSRWFRPRLLAKLATQTATATIAQPKHQLNVNTLEELAAKTLEFNAIGVAEITTDRPIVFEPYRDLAGGAPNRVLGGFILIDKLTNATVAAGMLHFALRRAENVHWQALDVSRETHARLKGQKPAVLWFTGFPARASRPSPTLARRSGLDGGTLSRSTATTSATASTRTRASPKPTGSRISAASARWRN